MNSLAAAAATTTTALASALARRAPQLRLSCAAMAGGSAKGGDAVDARARLTAPAALVDVGVNLGDAAFDGDRAAVLQRAREAGVEAIIVTGTSESSSRRAAQLCGDGGAATPTLTFTAGIHPHDAKLFEPEATEAWIRELAADPRCAAIGETGLDYNRNLSAPDVQRAAFAAQVRLARELQLPLFVHCREAAEDVAAVLRSELDGASLARTLVHCFTGTAEEADIFIELGVNIGITGWICDEREGRSESLADAVRKIPPDRLVIETDAPYLTPRSIKPGKARPRRNEPCLLPHVLNAVAAALDLDPTTVANTTTENARRIFSLSGKSA